MKVSQPGSGADISEMVLSKLKKVGDEKVFRVYESIEFFRVYML